MVSSLEYILNICLYAIVVGTITILISFFTGPYNKGSVVGSMVGYSLITVSLVFLLLVDSNKNNSGLLSILLSSGPFMVVIATTIYLLYLFGNYFNEIVAGRVSKSYSTFINLYLFILLMQFWIYFKNQKQDTKTYKMLLYLLGFFNSIIVITLGVILAYFSTDG